MWYFYFSEPLLRFPCVHHPFVRDPESGAAASFELDWDRAFTIETLYKFWIGFVVFPGLWFVVGTLLALRAARQIAALSSAAAKLEATLGESVDEWVFV